MLQSNTLQKKLTLLPKRILFLIVTISAIGMLLMYDASVGSISATLKKQLLYFILFLPVMFLFALVDIKFLFNVSYYIYAVSLALLIVGSFFGYKAMGAVRWMDIGIFRFQPSELMKIGVVLAFARYFHSIGSDKTNKLRSLIIPIMLGAIPLVIILKQPDLGTAIVIGIISAVMFFLAGVNISKFFVAIASFAVSAPFVWSHLHDYQKKRILIFFDPERDPLGAGYNIIQSKIAIGSGGLFGKGRLESTQSKLDFLPEHQTDFIFPLFAEKFGFLGSMILLLLYFILMLEVCYVGTNCKSFFGKLTVFGLISIFTTHIFINLGMVMGLMPVVGIPLPLISYGGSALGTTMIAFGIIINIDLNNQTRIAHNRLGYLS
jgi:rod shape determining protein RodA